MEIVINNGSRGQYSFQIDTWHMAVFSSVLCLMFVTLGIMAYLLNHNNIIAVGIDAGVVNAWQARLQQQEQQIARTRQQAGAQLKVLARRVAELQSELRQLDELSVRLAEAANVDIHKFIQEFHRIVPDPYEQALLDESIGILPSDFMVDLDNLGNQLISRAEQLFLLEKLLFSYGFSESMLGGIGRIVESGWISSTYGMRTDPFTQRTTMHKGLDIAGRQGTPIKAIAAGIVRFSGPRSAYGKLVEIDHGNGFITRYAHNHSNLVSIGDIVGKGQVIAQMGSTGRSTGSHVHFEILRNGEQLNPLSYIQAAQ